MPTPVTMPKLGLTMTRGEVVQWYKHDGETVEEGELLVVVMSKKITCEIDAPASGTVRIVTPSKGARDVGKPIGFVLEPGESLSERAISSSRGSTAGQAQRDPGHEPARQSGRISGEPPGRTPMPHGSPAGMPSSPAARRLARELGVDLTAVARGAEEGPIMESDVRAFHEEQEAAKKEGQILREIRSSPAARRLARELGLEIAQVARTLEGDGPITESDVRDAMKASVCDERRAVLATPLARRMAENEGLDLSRIAGSGPQGKVTKADVLQAMETASDGTTIPFIGMREAIAESMMESLRTTAQLTLTAPADVTQLVSVREALRQRWQERVGYNELIVKAVALALREHPLLNSTLAGDEIVLLSNVDVGVAVAVEDGLIVPIIRAADEKGVLDIHRELQEFQRCARQGSLSPDQVTGGTFTVTNLGSYGVDAFTPILNQPQVAILGVGQIAREPSVVGDEIVPRSKVTLSLTIDHRVVDGAPGAAFLRTVVKLLEHPGLTFAAGRNAVVAGAGR
jgi:pyruvate dehydrogenase E2 component (dihydrolipoamide acetyltransferase)